MEDVSSLMMSTTPLKILQGEGREQARALLAGSVKHYTKEVEAHVRVSKKQGFKHKPKTAVEVGLLIAGQLQTLNTTMQGIYDIVRSNVGSPFSRSSGAFAAHANRVVL